MVTIAIDDEINLCCNLVPNDADVIWTASVTLIKLFLFELFLTTVGLTDTPFFNIFSIVPMDDFTLLNSVIEPTIDEVNWLVSVTLIWFIVLLTTAGKILIESLVVLTNVWTDCGKCFTALVDADTNVCTDCGRCLTASNDDDTNVCTEPEALPASPTLIVNVPVCLSILFSNADTNVCSPTYDEEPILILNVLVDTLEISNHLPEG